MPDYLPEGVMPTYVVSRCLQIAASLVGPAVDAFVTRILQDVLGHHGKLMTKRGSEAGER